MCCFIWLFHEEQTSWEWGSGQVSTYHNALSTRLSEILCLWGIFVACGLPKLILGVRSLMLLLARQAAQCVTLTCLFGVQSLPSCASSLRLSVNLLQIQSLILLLCVYLDTFFNSLDALVFFLHEMEIIICFTAGVRINEVLLFSEWLLLWLFYYCALVDKHLACQWCWMC